MFFRLSVFFILVIALSACVEPPFSDVDNEMLKQMLEQGVPIYDVRRPEEWQQTGVIKGSQLLTFEDADGNVLPDFLSRFTRNVGKEDAVILIGSNGSRTSTLALYLAQQMGYTHVYNAGNGISKWISDGRPVIHL
ncbi:MAG: rhodanese-like domain-containing protein [Candidatus Thiodiazotropha endolucinida]